MASPSDAAAAASAFLLSLAPRVSLSLSLVFPRPPPSPPSRRPLGSLFLAAPSILELHWVLSADSLPHRRSARTVPQPRPYWFYVILLLAIYRHTITVPTQCDLRIARVLISCARIEAVAKSSPSFRHYLPIFLLLLCLLCFISETPPSVTAPLPNTAAPRLRPPNLSPARNTKYTHPSS